MLSVCTNSQFERQPAACALLTLATRRLLACPKKCQAPHRLSVDKFHTSYAENSKKCTHDTCKNPLYQNQFPLAGPWVHMKLLPQPPHRLCWHYKHGHQHQTPPPQRPTVWMTPVQTPINDGKMPPSKHTNHPQEPTLQLYTHCEASAASNSDIKTNCHEVSWYMSTHVCATRRMGARSRSLSRLTGAVATVRSRPHKNGLCS